MHNPPNLWRAFLLEEKSGASGSAVLKLFGGIGFYAIVSGMTPPDAFCLCTYLSLACERAVKRCLLYSCTGTGLSGLDFNHPLPTLSPSTVSYWNLFGCLVASLPSSSTALLPTYTPPGPPWPLIIYPSALPERIS
jgi:hypothetical protein